MSQSLESMVISPVYEDSVLRWVDVSFKDSPGFSMRFNQDALKDLVNLIGHHFGIQFSPHYHSIEWVVNSSGELGVKIGETIAFLYKGASLQYDESSNMKWRHVEKREFGECCHPRTMPENGDELPYTKGIGWKSFSLADRQDHPAPVIDVDLIKC